MSVRRSLDAELIRRKLVSNKDEAQQLISDGKILVSGAVATNPARQVSPGESVNVVPPAPQYVSRGGEKLAGALERFALDITGRRVLDIGASTGGFTDCALQHGAATVVALDVGHSQLHERIRADDRVDVRERVNARSVTLADFDHSPFSLMTVDVSFISLRTIAGVLTGPIAGPGSDVITLIKPQFEAGKQEVSRGKGVVRDPETWRDVLERVIATMEELGAATMGVMSSPLLGAEGNVEFLAWFRPHSTEQAIADSQSSLKIDAVLAEVNA